MTSSPLSTYSHTQKGPLALFFYGAALFAFVLAWLGRHQSAAAAVAAGSGAFTVLFGFAFHHLTVADEGDRLAIRFGPLPVFRTSVRYDDIKQVEIGQTTLIEGWGIHPSPRGGWVWNIWGWDCVVIHRSRGTLRIGTDDAENLARFLESRMPHLEVSR